MAAFKLNDALAVNGNRGSSPSNNVRRPRWRLRRDPLIEDRLVAVRRAFRSLLNQLEKKFMRRASRNQRSADTVASCSMAISAAN
jgi:hypothetical protein